MAERLYTPDTIAALAAPPGRGGVGIIRVSGPACREIAQAMVGHCPAPDTLTTAPFKARRAALMRVSPCSSMAPTRLPAKTYWNSGTRRPDYYGYVAGALRGIGGPPGPAR